MLDNIKLVLGLSDTSKDNLINYYISVTTNKILAYINATELPATLESIVEEIVINKMKSAESGVDTSGTVKREKVGDYEIEYNTSSSSGESVSNELSPYTNILNKYTVKKVVFV